MHKMGIVYIYIDVHVMISIYVGAYAKTFMTCYANCMDKGNTYSHLLNIVIQVSTHWSF